MTESPVVSELAANDLPAAEFSRYLVDRYGVSIVLDSSLYDVPVTLSVKDERLDIVAELFARQLQAEVVTVGRTWYIGSGVSTDQSLLLVRFPRLKAEQLQSVIGSFLSADAVVEVLEDGIVIVSDTPRNLRRVAEFRQSLDGVESITWAVQIYLVRDSYRRFADLGIDLGPSIDLAYTAAKASGGALFEVPNGISGQVVAGLTAALRAQQSDTDSFSRVSPMLMCVDGHQSRYQDGQELYLPTGSVNQTTGNSVDTGFTTISTGLIVTIQVRETDYQTARLTLDLETSLPIEGDQVTIDRRQLSCVADVRDGGVYLLGEVASAERSKNLQTWLSSGIFERGSNTRYQVWARCYRIGGPTGDSSQFDARYGQSFPDLRSSAAQPTAPARVPAVGNVVSRGLITDGDSPKPAGTRRGVFRSSGGGIKADAKPVTARRPRPAVVSGLPTGSGSSGPPRQKANLRPLPVGGHSSGSVDRTEPIDVSDAVRSGDSPE